MWKLVVLIFRSSSTIFTFAFLSLLVNSAIAAENWRWIAVNDGQDAWIVKTGKHGEIVVNGKTVRGKLFDKDGYDVYLLEGSIENDQLSVTLTVLDTDWQPVVMKGERRTIIFDKDSRMLFPDALGKEIIELYSNHFSFIGISRVIPANKK